MQTKNPSEQEQAPTAVASGDWLASPRRIQLSRKRGYRKPDNAVRVTRPGKYGNPYHVGVHGDAAKCVALFEAMMEQELAAGRMKDMLAELRGKDLACFCPLNAPCHADVLLRLANNNI
jgi:hypothetical protein